MTTETGQTGTLRQQFLAAAEEIAAVYRDTSGPIGYEGRKRVQDAYTRLQQLGTWIPAIAAGWLPYGDMADKDIGQALRRAEDGWASPEITLRLIRQVHALRQELTAFGGAYGVTDDDIQSMLAEGFHTAWRKATDTPESVVIWKLIKDMDPEEWGDVIRFVASPFIAALREAEQHAAAKAGTKAGEDPALAGRRAYEQFWRNAGQEPGDWDAEPEEVRDSWTAVARAAAGPGKDAAS